MIFEKDKLGRFKKGHSNKNRDIHRENEIKKELNCKFLRINDKY